MYHNFDLSTGMWPCGQFSYSIITKQSTDVISRHEFSVAIKYHIKTTILNVKNSIRPTSRLVGDHQHPIATSCHTLKKGSSILLEKK